MLMMWRCDTQEKDSNRNVDGSKDDDGSNRGGNANEVAYHSGAEAKYIFDLKQNLINFVHKAQIIKFEFIKSWSFQVICIPLFGD